MGPRERGLGILQQQELSSGPGPVDAAGGWGWNPRGIEEADELGPVRKGVSGPGTLFRYAGTRLQMCLQESFRTVLRPEKVAIAAPSTLRALGWRSHQWEGSHPPSGVNALMSQSLLSFFRSLGLDVVESTVKERLAGKVCQLGVPW